MNTLFCRKNALLLLCMATFLPTYPKHIGYIPLEYTYSSFSLRLSQNWIILSFKKSPDALKTSQEKVLSLHKSSKPQDLRDCLFYCQHLRVRERQVEVLLRNTGWPGCVFWASYMFSFLPRIPRTVPSANIRKD